MNSQSSPLIWALSDGRAGIERQALAFANCLAQYIKAKVEKVKINPKGTQTRLPPQLWPAPIKALHQNERNIFINPVQKPDIIVANGRRSIPYSLWAKKNWPQTKIIQLQNPKVSPKRFDYVIAPRHDRIKGKNVKYTLGGLVWYSPDAIGEAQKLFPQYKKEDDAILVILGGNSKTHEFNEEKSREILGQLQKLASEGHKMWITTSRRTPQKISAIFRAFAKENGFAFFGSENEDGANPYLCWLNNAKYALVSEDSANMLADCAFFGLPIHLLRLKGQSRKFNRLHQSFIESGAAIWFGGQLEFFSYQMEKNVENIAAAIAKSL